MNRGVSKVTATELIQRHQADAIKAKIEVFDWLIDKKDKRVAKSPAGYLVKSITDDYTKPKGFISKTDAAALSDKKHQAEQVAAEESRRKQSIERAERHLADQVKTYRQSRTSEQLSQLESAAVAQASEETRRNLDDPAIKHFRQTQITMLVNEHLARLIQSGQLAIEPT